ncbi:MAG: hypothetical protein IT423_18010 [Pirellulaceae bacterium]|nr:hypothetical protein [Pirellulaceae bacterium]
MSILIAGAAPAVARINVNLQVEYYDENGEMINPFMAGSERWDAATGQRVLRYDVETEYGSAPETVDATALGPDGYLYALGHNMAELSIIKLDPSTGQTTSIHSTYFSGGGALDFDVNGDLIATGQNYSQDYPGTSIEGGDAGKIWRFNGYSEVLKDAFELSVNKFITWFALTPGERALFALGHWGASKVLSKYSYSSEINSLHEDGTFDLGIKYNGIWVGPDGLIYLKDYHNNWVDRYTQSGGYLDRFTNDNLSDFTWFEEKLLAVQAGRRVVELDPTDGSIIRTLIDANSHEGPGTLYFGGMTVFSVIPEPGTACLLLCCLSAITIRPLSRQWL